MARHEQRGDPIGVEAFLPEQPGVSRSPPSADLRRELPESEAELSASRPEAPPGSPPKPAAEAGARALAEV